MTDNIYSEQGAELLERIGNLNERVLEKPIVYNPKVKRFGRFKRFLPKFGLSALISSLLLISSPTNKYYNDAKDTTPSSHLSSTLSVPAEGNPCDVDTCVLPAAVVSAGSSSDDPPVDKDKPLEERVIVPEMAQQLVNSLQQPSKKDYLNYSTNGNSITFNYTNSDLQKLIDRAPEGKQAGVYFTSQHLDNSGRHRSYFISAESLLEQKTINVVDLRKGGKAYENAGEFNFDTDSYSLKLGNRDVGNGWRMDRENTYASVAINPISEEDGHGRTPQKINLRESGSVQDNYIPDQSSDLLDKYNDEQDSVLNAFTFDEYKGQQGCFDDLQGLEDLQQGNFVPYDQFAANKFNKEAENLGKSIDDHLIDSTLLDIGIGYDLSIDIPEDRIVYEKSSEKIIENQLVEKIGFFGRVFEYFKAV